jgi:hypothetical protein
MGQLASHLGERDKGKLPNQPVNNLKPCTIGSASNQEHAHTIVTLRLGRQVDNRVADPEVVDEVVPATDLAGQEETKSDNKEKKDVEPSTVTRIDKDLTRSLMYKFNCTRQLHESIVVMWLCKCECRTHRESCFVENQLLKCLN